jgi:hypothetical protein
MATLITSTRTGVTLTRPLALMLLSAAIAPAAPSLISHTAAGSITTFTTPAINTSGANFIIASIFYETAGGAVLSDSSSNTWSTAMSQGAGGQTQTTYYVLNPTTSSTHTFTITGSGTMYASLEVAAFSGVLGADVSSNICTPSNFPLSAGSILPTQNGDLIVSAIGFYTGGGWTGTLAVGNGYSLTDTVPMGSTFGGSLAYLVQDTTTATNPVWTATDPMTQACATTIAFKSSALKSGPAIISRHKVVGQ